MDILVKEPFLLDKITKHQPVEHQRSVPLLVAVLLVGDVVVDPPDEIQKSGMLLLELVVELLRDLFGIPGKVLGDPLLDIDNRDFLLLVERKKYVAHPLEQDFGILMAVPDNLTYLPWLILLFDSQLPDLLRLCRIGIND